MPSKFEHIKINIEIECLDIRTMNDMSDADYRDYVHGEGLMSVDHHDILRSSIAGYPLATTREQLDILIDELTQLRRKMVPRPEA